MSVLIKDMKMPDCCASCPLLEYDDYATGKEHRCNALNVVMSWDDLPEGRRSDCPLDELIRCKDCRHAQKSVFKEKFKRCDYNGELKHVEDFCSWAERRNPDV